MVLLDEFLKDEFSTIVSKYCLDSYYVTMQSMVLVIDFISFLRKINFS